MLLVTKRLIHVDKMNLQYMNKLKKSLYLSYIMPFWLYNYGLDLVFKRLRHDRF